MKSITQKCVVSVLAMIFLIIMNSSSAICHDMWFEVRDYTPELGDDITLTLAYGHHFPARGFMDKDRLKEIYAISPDGNRLEVESDSEVEFKTSEPVKESGTFLIAGAQKGGFSTKTTEGYKRGKNKKHLNNVIECRYGGKYSKAIVNVGEASGSAYSTVLGQELEIVPLADPGVLEEGDYLPIKILYKDKPLASSQVFGTYVGFSTEKNTFAYATQTNKEGVAKIKILESGVWLVAASHVEDYPDPDECDIYRFKSALTFEVQ
jgi:uncharacterized GH25 family protein